MFGHSEVDVKAGTAGTKETKALLPVKVGTPEVIKPDVRVFRNVGGLVLVVASVGGVVAVMLLVLVLL